MIQLALYKGDGGFLNKAIRIFNRLHRMGDNTKYSHCELIIDGNWYTSSFVDGGVRVRHINGKNGNWDFIDIPSTVEQEELIKKLFTPQKNKKYDLLGIVLSQVIPLDIQSPRRWFCSEICVYLLNASDVVKFRCSPQSYSPATLAEKIKKELK